MSIAWENWASRTLKPLDWPRPMDGDCGESVQGPHMDCRGRYAEALDRFAAAPAAGRRPKTPTLKAAAEIRRLEEDDGAVDYFAKSLPDLLLVDIDPAAGRRRRAAELRFALYEGLRSVAMH